MDLRSMVKRADPQRVEKSGPTAGGRTRAKEQKSIPNRRDEHVQKKNTRALPTAGTGTGLDENQTKFKISV